MARSNETTTRRAALALIAGAALAPTLSRAQPKPAVIVHKDPNCGCCDEWSGHLRRAGFSVTFNVTSKLAAVRAVLGVPEALASCHTAEVGGYLVEGHVPVVAIERLLAERPRATGLAVPGMPIGSPGMEQGPPETYDVLLFGPQGVRRYARFHGNTEI